jgi:hypothetical protein
MSTSPVSGACMAAPIIAAAHTIAYAPAGEPGHSSDQASPVPAPSTAPVDRVGVNSPPAAPLPRQAAVTSGFSANRARNASVPPAPRNASCAMSLPLPNSCGYAKPSRPSSPKVTIITGIETQPRA